MFTSEEYNFDFKLKIKTTLFISLIILKAQKRSFLGKARGKGGILLLLFY